jgi:hypothetical protein
VRTLIFVASLALLTATSFAQQWNEECTGAVVIGAGINPGAPNGTVLMDTYSNAGTTASSGSPVCIAALPDVWFKWTATGTGPVTIKTCTPAGFPPGSLADTVLSVFGPGPCPSTNLLACNDDSCGVLSSVTVNVSQGANYYVRVGGYAGATGTFYVVVDASLAIPSNDNCSNPIVLVPGLNGPFTNAGATSSSISASCVPSWQDVWFTFTASCTGIVSIDTCGSYMSTVLSVYASCGGPELACNGQGQYCVSNVAFPATQGVSYRVRVASPAQGAFGNFNVTVNNGLMWAFPTKPFGSGSLRVDIANGPPNGTYFYAVTPNQGAYPLGWFFGLDLSMAELTWLLNAGPPFIGTLDGCGGHTIGPFTGLGPLVGMTFYAKPFGFPPGSTTMQQGASNTITL